MNIFISTVNYQNEDNSTFSQVIGALTTQVK